MFNCPVCDRVSDSLKGFSIHVARKHKLTLEQLYLTYRLQGARPTCRCGCGQEPTFRSWETGFGEFMLGHNGRLSCLPEEEAAAITEKRKAALTGQVGWSRGLTKETSEVIRDRSEKISTSLAEGYASGRLTVKNKGKTKETDEGVRKGADKLREGFKVGRLVPWMKGMTRSKDVQVAQMADKVRRSCNDMTLRKRLDALKRLTPEQIVARLKERAPDLILLSDLALYTSDTDVNLEFSCVKCSTVALRSLVSALTNRCFTCDPAGSYAQLQVRDFVASLVPSETVLSSVRSVISANARLEADVYLPARKFAVEYNGLYFHSSVHADKRTHERKSRLFSQEGITVFHVFEDEWRDKRPIVESMIKHRLGLSSRKIFARKCEVVKLTHRERIEFFHQNHLDGDVASSVAWGLKHEGELVSALSLRTPFHTKYRTDALEVGRSCSKLDVVVPGGLSRLMNKAEEYCREKGKKYMMTYVDLRHGTGGSYLQSGFERLSETPPRFWWTDFNLRYNRFKFKADKMRGLTEEQVAVENNVHKIWGCGNVVLVRRFL